METHRPVVALVGVPAFHRGRPGLQAAVQTQLGLRPRGEPTRPRGEPTRPWDGSTQQDHRRRRSLSQAQNRSLLTYLKGKDLTGEQPGAPALPWNHAKATHATEQALARHKRGCRQKLRNEGRNPKRTRTAAVSRRGRRGGAVGCSQPCAHAGATKVAPAKLPSGNRHCAVGTATETNAGGKGGGATPTFLSG